MCGATPAQDEGPYFVEENLLRSDLTTDTANANARNGVPLILRFTVLRVVGTSCSPLSGAHVDVWHADTQGLYSDECVQSTVGDKSLRGYQITDGSGLVEFKTIFPGWYLGRTIHIHAKIRLYSGSVKTLEFTTQLYVSDDITDRIMATPPYDTRGTRNTTNLTDALYTSGVLDGGAFRLPPELCAQVEAGAAVGGPPASGPVPALSADSLGPSLVIDVTPMSNGAGLLGTFVFGIQM